MLEEGIVSLLLAQTSISSVIGNRLYAVLLPDTVVFPALTYQVASYSTGYNLDGPEGIGHKRFVFSAWAKDYATAKRLIESIRQTFNNFIFEEFDFGDGGFGDGEFGDANSILPDGTQVYSIEVVNELDFWEDGPKVFRCVLHAMTQYAD
jgi:hypothetical protein